VNISANSCYQYFVAVSCVFSSLNFWHDVSEMSWRFVGAAYFLHSQIKRGTHVDTYCTRLLWNF